MRFDEDASYPEVVKSLPHVAFEVDDLARALEGREILIAPNSPSPGVTVAMIIDDGAPAVWYTRARSVDSKGSPMKHAEHLPPFLSYGSRTILPRV